MIELDNNATTRPSERVIERMGEALRTSWHNPSSVHRGGQDARRAVELARRTVAEFVGVRPREVVFCGDGTEAIELALRGRVLAARARGGGAGGVETPAIVTSKLEHSAVRDLVEAMAARGEIEARWLGIGPGGRVDPASLDGLLDESVAAVSVQWANNETGVIQPIERIAETCLDHRVALHVDATQRAGKLPMDLEAIPGIGLATLSPHKFHGPKGIGVLIARRGVSLGVVRPGSQELGRRGGTENVPGILGAAAACEEAADFLADAGERARLAGLRDRLESLVLAGLPGAVVNGSGERLWNTTNIGFPRLEAEALLLSLSERGVAASAGAACSSGSLEPSSVLLAMGVAPEVAHGSIRLSLSRETTQQEIERAADLIVGSARRLAEAAGLSDV